MMQRAPQRRRNGSRPRADFDDPAIRIVSHHDAARVAGQTLGRFRGDVRAVVEDRLTGRIGVRQHRRVDVDHDLVALARGAGIDSVVERCFGDEGQRVRLLLLNALEARVSISNQNLAVSEAQYRQARALVREARAAYFPTVTLGLGYTRSRQSGSATSTGTSGSSGSSGGARSDFQLGLDFSWELDVWGRIRRGVESNKAAAQASAGDLEAARLSFQAELAQDYFQLRTLDAQKQLLDETVAAFEKFLRLTQDRFANGVASQADVVQAQTQLKTTQAQAIDVGVQRAQLEHAIAILMGQAPSSFSLPPTPLAATPPAIPVGVPSELLERRPDIAAAERRVAAANAQIGVAVAAFYPTITLNASSGFESSSLAQWFTAASHFWSVGPGISQTVFDGGLRHAQTDAARAALTTQQYKAGTVSYLNVITVQTISLTDEITAIQIRGRRMAAAVLLVQALGGGWRAP